jgi:predicted nucleic acid-binding protein
VKIYLDNCALGRPEDTQTGLVALQAEAVLQILEGVRQGRWELIRSSMHLEEAWGAEAWRAAAIQERLSLATEPTCDSVDALDLYDVFRAAPRGKAPLLKALDGYHLATAVYYGASAFITVDRALFLWARAHKTLLEGTAVMRPGEFLGRFGHGKDNRRE